jgi:hypothetical protein
MRFFFLTSRWQRRSPSPSPLPLPARLRGAPNDPDRRPLHPQSTVHYLDYLYSPFFIFYCISVGQFVRSFVRLVVFGLSCSLFVCESHS